MRKIYFSIFLTIFLYCVSCVASYAYYSDALSEHKKPIALSQGSFLRASMQREVSSATNKVGDEIRMIATSPTFAADALIVPENSLYLGEIIEINQPIEGANASLRIKINKVVFPNGDEMQIDGMLWSKNHNLFGGELTMPAYYSKIPHFTEGWKGGCLAFQNIGIYKVGVPTIIKAGTELLIILQQNTDFYAYEL